MSPRSHCRLGACSTTIVSGPARTPRPGRGRSAAAVRPGRRGCAGTDEHRRRRLPAAALGVEQRGHRPRLERVGADPVDRVGRQDHQVAPPDRLDGGGDPAVPLGGAAAVVEHHAVQSANVAAVAKRGRPARSRWSVISSKAPAARSSAGTDLAVGVVVLDPEPAARAQQGAATRITGADHGQAVRSGEDRDRADRARATSTRYRGAGRHVRRVAEQQVDPAVEFGQGGRVGDVAARPPRPAAPARRRCAAATRAAG